MFCGEIGGRLDDGDVDECVGENSLGLSVHAGCLFLGSGSWVMLLVIDAHREDHLFFVWLCGSLLQDVVEGCSRKAIYLNIRIGEWGGFG